MDNKSRKKLNIAIVFDPLVDYKSGAHASIFRFAERLRNNGHKIIFIAAETPEHRSNDYFKEMKVYRFHSVLLPFSEKSWYISFPSLKKVKKIFEEEKIDILHTTLPLPANIVCVKAAKALGIKIIVHSHSQPENAFLYLPRYLGHNFLNRLFYQYLIWLYRQGNAMVYPSEFAQKMFGELNKEMANIVISNGIDIEEFKKMEAGDFITKFNLSRDSKKILFVGRFHPEKSIETLINAVPHIIEAEPKIEVIIVGGGNQEKSLKRLAANLGVSDKVFFCGKLNEQDKILAYNASDVFVLPSLAELEGIVVLEAMACGKPIVVANSPNSASTYFVDQNGFLFEPQNPKDLAEKIIKILGDDGLRKNMADASLKKSRQYDINKSVKQLEETYYSVLSR